MLPKFHYKLCNVMTSLFCFVLFLIQIRVTVFKTSDYFFFWSPFLVTATVDKEDNPNLSKLRNMAENSSPKVTSRSSLREEQRKRLKADMGCLQLMLLSVQCWQPVALGVLWKAVLSVQPQSMVSSILVQSLWILLNALLGLLWALLDGCVSSTVVERNCLLFLFCFPLQQILFPE